MNKLVACALLGFGLTQVLVGCGDDDDSTPGASGTGTAGSSAGKSSGGTSSAGSSSGGTGSAGKAGSATGGTGTAGSATAGSAGKGGSATAGSSSVGGEGGVAGETGMAGDGGVAGDGGMAGAGGAPTVAPQEATQLWLSDFCKAKSLEVLGCDSSPAFYDCFGPLRPFLSTVGEGICPGEEGDGDPLVNTLALYDALDALAAACPAPDVDQWKCTLGVPQAKDQACQDADDARRVAVMNCGL